MPSYYSRLSPPRTRTNSLPCTLHLPWPQPCLLFSLTLRHAVPWILSQVPNLPPVWPSSFKVSPPLSHLASSYLCFNTPHVLAPLEAVPDWPGPPEHPGCGCTPAPPALHVNDLSCATDYERHEAETIVLIDDIVFGTE